MNPQNITSQIPSQIPSSIPPEIPYIEKQFVLTFKFSAIQSFILTILAELGDKTFIMLIILQLKTNKVTILFSSLFAELLMNSIAIFIGWTIDYMLYKNLIDYIGIGYLVNYLEQKMKLLKMKFYQLIKIIIKNYHVKLILLKKQQN